MGNLFRFVFEGHEGMTMVDNVDPFDVTIRGLHHAALFNTDTKLHEAEVVATDFDEPEGPAGLGLVAVHPGRPARQ